MKKVLIITYYWPPSGGGGVQRWLKLAKYLKRFDIEPIVLTVKTKYATYPHIDNQFEKEAAEIRTYRTKSFEALKFYSWLVGKKNVPHSAFANVNKNSFVNRAARFLRGNLFLPDPRKGWNRYALKMAGQIIKSENIQSVITTSPPHSTQLMGMALKKKFGIEWIADFRDPWTDIFYYKDLMALPQRKEKEKMMELEVLEKADKIVTVSASLKVLFSKKSIQISNDKIQIIPNGFDPEDFEGIEEADNKDFCFGYIGSLTEIYGPERLIEGFAKLKNKYRFHIRFIGNVSPGVQKMIKDQGLMDRTTFIDRVDHQRAVEEMMSVNALLLFIPQVKNNDGILTGKIFEYLATKKPIIGIGPEKGDAAQLLNKFSEANMFDYQSDAMDIYLDSILKRFYLEELPTNAGELESFSREAQAYALSRMI